MSDQLPDPMVPAEVDLRGLEYMPLLGARLFSSDFALNASDAEFRRGLQLWWAAWNQVPAASLPDSDRAQAKLAGFEDETSPNWRKVRKQALDGFIKCSDGRLYHPVLARQALIAWEKRGEVRAETENAAERQRRTRAERKRMFAELRERGVTAKWDIPMADLRALYTAHVTGPVTHPVTPPVTAPVTPPVTASGHEPVTVTNGVTITAKTGRDETGINTEPLADSPPLVETPSSPAPASPSPTRYGAIAKALRAQGISANPQHPRFMALVDAGATANEFLVFAEKAKAMGNPFAYLLATLESERKRAAELKGQLHEGPMPGSDEATEWHETAGGVKTRGAELGVPYTREDECRPFDAYKRRVMAKHREQQGAAA